MFLQIKDPSCGCPCDESPANYCFVVHIRAPDFWKLPGWGTHEGFYGSSYRTVSRTRILNLGHKAFGFWA